MGPGEVFKLFATLGIDATEFDAGLAGAEQKLNATAQAFSGAGRTLTMGVTAPIVGLGTAALHSSITFESAFAGVRKTVDATEEEFDALEQGIRDMATRIPASAESIAQVAEAAGQLGISTENILSFTETMIGLGESTNMTADVAATSLARFANIVQMPQDQFENLGSVIVDLGNNLATTEAEITEMGLRLAGAGNQVGLSEAEILGFAGALSSVGVSAEAGGTAFSRVMLNMQSAVMSGGDELESFATTAGMTSDEFAQTFQKDPVAAIESFIGGLQRIQAEGGNVIGALDDVKLGEIRVRDALLRLAGAGDVMTDSVNLATAAWGENAALQEEVGRRYETTESQLSVAKNTLQEVGRTLGDALVPFLLAVVEAAKPLIGALQSLAEWFGNLDPRMQQFIVAGFGITAAIGPILWAVGTLAGSITNLLPLLRLVPGAFGAIRGALALLTGPVGWIITAVGLIAAAWSTDFLGLRTWATEQWGLIVDRFTEAWGRLREIGQGIADNFRDSWQTATGWFSQAQENIDGNLRAIEHNLKVAGLAVGDIFRGDWQGALAHARELFDNWWWGLNDVLGGLPERMKAHLSNLTGAVKAGWDFVVSAFQSAREAVTSNLDAIKHNLSIAGSAIDAIFRGDWNAALLHAREIIGNWWSSLSDFFAGIPAQMLEFGKNMIQGLMDGVKSMLTGAVDAVKGVGQSVIDGFKNLLGIESPSKVFYGFGVDIGEGLAQGIESSEGRVKEAVEGLTKRVFKASGAFDPAGLAAALTSGLAEKDAIAAIRARLAELTGQRDHVMEHYGSNRFKNIALGFINPQIEALNDELARLRQELVTTRNHTAREGEAQTRRFSMAVTTFGADVRSLTLAKQRY